MLKLSKLISLYIITALLTACSVADPKLGNANGEEIEKALREDITSNKKLHMQPFKSKVPDAIQKALMPAVPSSDISVKAKARDATTNETFYTASTLKDQQRFNISVNNVPAQDFFTGLVKNTIYNMTVSPQVSGMISLELKNVTVAEVMDTVRDVYGFEYEFTPSGYQVLPRHLETRIFTVNYLDIERGGKSNTNFSSGELTRTTTSQAPSATNVSGSSSTQKTAIPSGNVETSSKANFWDELKQNLLAVIGTQDGKSVVMNPQSGVVIIRAYPDELRNIAEYLDNIQNNMNRQVIIEAQILEVQLDAQFQSGINWKLFDLQQGAYFNTVTSSSLGATTGIDEIPSSFSSIFTLQPSSGNTFKSFIQLLNTQGKVNVLSSPRIATTNNQKAVIKVGGDKFFVTNVTSNNTTSGSAVGTTQNIELTPFFSGIALDVTPQINSTGEITLHIHPVVSQVSLDRQQFVVNDQNQDLPLAQSSVRESDSVIHARSGQVIVIGGLMASKDAQYGASTPGTEHLGFFSALFKSTNKSSTKLELVILLRPVVVNASYNWNQNLQNLANRFKSMKGEDFRYQIVKSS